MKNYKYTVTVDSEWQKFVNYDRLNEIFEDISNIVDLLYCIQKADIGKNVNFENYFYQKLIDNLKLCRTYLNGAGVNAINSSIDILNKGNFDILDIPLLSDDCKAELIFGKIVSQENNNEKRYGAALGVPDEFYNALVDRLDGVLKDIHTSIPFYEVNNKSDFTEHKSEFRCMKVFSFSGELRRSNKPISLFYSGGRTNNLSSLSKVVVFSNVYFSRFEHISSLLGRKYIDDFGTVDALPEDLRNTAILYWLRGHDTGHFFGRDNLGTVMKGERYIYYSLHELKSDIISLYILTHFDSVWGIRKDTISTDTIFKIYFAEILRYLRRGGIGMFPDTSSAWLAFNYYIQKEVISFDRDNGLFHVDRSLIKSITAELCDEIFDIFKRGDSSAATEFYNRYINPVDDDMASFINDGEIPYYIDLNDF